MAAGRQNLPRFLLLIPPLLFLLLFYFYPLLKIFLLSFTEDVPGRGQGFRKLLQSTHYLRIFWFTFWQAAVSAVLTLILALPGAYVFARFRFPGKKFLQAFSTVPFVLPTVVVAAAFQSLLGPKGIFNQCLIRLFDLSAPPVAMDRSIYFILLAHIFYNYTVVLRIVGGFWAQMETSAADAARMLGASPLICFRRITFPLLRPAVISAGLLVFIFCFSSFGVVLILGGPRFATLEVEIYRQAVHLFNLPLAAALSLIQILFTFLIMRTYTALQRSSSRALHPESPGKSRKKAFSPGEKLMVWGNITAMLLFLGLPLLSLLLRSLFTEQGFSLIYYFSLFQNENQSLFFVPPLYAIRNSLGFAGISALMALLLGIPAALFLVLRKDRLTAFLDPLFMLPLSTSAVTLGFGFIISLDRPPLNLRTSLLLLPIAHCLVAFPFVVRSLLPVLRSIPCNLRESAALLGASPRQVWCSVDLPIIRRALLVAAVFAFTVSLGEFGASVFVARPHTPTMPLAIYRFLGQPGHMNYGQAMAMSSLLMLVSAVSFLCIEKFRMGNTGEF